MYVIPHSLMINAHNLKKSKLKLISYHSMSYAHAMSYDHTMSYPWWVPGQAKTFHKLFWILFMDTFSRFIFFLEVRKKYTTGAQRKKIIRDE